MSTDARSSPDESARQVILRTLEAMRAFPLYYTHGLMFADTETLYLMASDGLIEQLGNPYWPKWRITDAGTAAIREVGHA